MQNYNVKPHINKLQMLQNEIKSSFIALGKFLNQFSFEKKHKDQTVLNNDLFYDDFITLIELSQSHNGWFTPEQVYYTHPILGRSINRKQFE